MNAAIRNSSGERLDYTFHPAPSPSLDRIVLIGHGVTGNKDRPWATGLAGALAAAGVPALRFSFSGNGASEGRFADSTISKEVDDLGSLLEAVSAAGYRSITYAGHSMGSATGVLRATTDSRITGLVSLAGMVHTAQFCQTEFGQEIPGQGYMWENPDCPLSLAFVDDMRSIHSVLGQASLIHVPWLFVHGDQDDVVPIAEGREMFSAASEPKTWVEIPGGDHVLSGDALLPMTEAVVRFAS